MATHSRILAWRIPWTREPDRLESDRAKVTEHWSHVCCVLPSQKGIIKEVASISCLLHMNARLSSTLYCIL